MAKELRSIRGALITIGDEILFGDIPNGNAHHIALELRARGFRLDRMVTVGDDEDEIVKELSRCHQESAFLIVTGGLGPTDDDRTNDAVARAFNRNLVLDTGYAKWLRERLASQKRPWTEQVAKMAHMPEGAVKLGVGMVGYFLEHQNIPCFFLPGVPHEMKSLVAEFVLPELAERFPERLLQVKEVLRIEGFFESELNRRIKTLELSHAGVEIGYLPHDAEVRLTLMAAAESVAEAERRVAEVEEQLIGVIGREHLIGRNGETLERAVGTRLRARNWRLALAESCTGGLVARKITLVAGASDYFERGVVAYSNQAKVDLLKVAADVIARHGAVSEEAARAMVRGIRAEAGVEAALATTGIAGPSGGTDDKPVGTVFIACATPDREVVAEHHFSGSRELIQERTAQAALILLWRNL